MAIVLTDTIKPAGSFPIAESGDIQMPDGRKLSDHAVVSSTTLPKNGILKANVMYFLGEVKSMSIGFPEKTNLGDMIYMAFKSGDSATALTITTSNHVGLDELEMQAKHFYEIIGVWHGTEWMFTTNEVKIEVS